MKRKILYLGLALSVVGSPLLADDTIRAGTDVFVTQSDGNTYVDLDLPAGFFCTSSAPFSGRITLTGSPVATSPAGALGKTDTVVERLGDTTFNSSNVATVNAIVRAASFRSTAPITVSGCSGSSLWDVRSSAAPTQTPFLVTIRRSSSTATGGSFDANVTISPRLTFIQQGTGLTRTLDQASVTFSTSGAEWTHVPGTGGVTSSSSVQIDTDGNGVPDTIVPPTSNFAPGWSRSTKSGCSVPPCPAPVPHQAPSHFHWVMPPKSGSLCVSTANCWDGSTVSCSGNVSASSCTAVDSACPDRQGSVTCDGVTTFCPACPAVCTNGATRAVVTGFCCDNGTTEKEKQVCDQGQWQPTGSFLCSGACPF